MRQQSGLRGFDKAPRQAFRVATECRFFKLQSEAGFEGDYRPYLCLPRRLHPLPDRLDFIFRFRRPDAVRLVGRRRQISGRRIGQRFSRWLAGECRVLVFLLEHRAPQAFAALIALSCHHGIRGRVTIARGTCARPAYSIELVGPQHTGGLDDIVLLIARRVVFLGLLLPFDVGIFGPIRCRRRIVASWRR